MKDILLFSLLCISVTTYAQDNCGEWVNGIRYTACNPGTDSAYAQVVEVEGSPVKLKFPNTVKLAGKRIPVKAIVSLGSGGTDLQEVTLPETLENLSGFMGCRQLAYIEIPKSVTRIKSKAFKGCVSLRHIVLPEGLREIELWAFGGCTNLSQVTLPSTLKTLGTFAFEECSALGSVAIPHSLKEIGSGVFQKCTGLTHVQLNSPMKQIPNLMFSGCSSLS